MGMFGLGKKKSPDITAMIFDIGSGSIGAAMVTLSKSKLPNIIWSKRIPITFQETPDYDKLSKTMLSTLLDISLEMQTATASILKQAGIRNPMKIMFAFASPWYSMQAKVFRLEKEEPFVLTEQFIKRLIKKEEGAFKERLHKASGGNEPSVLVERQVVQTSLNGYIVSNPYNKAVKKSRVDLILSAIPSYIYEKIIEIKTQLVPGKDWGGIHSFILPAFIVTRDIFHNKKSFLFMDITAEVTDIVTVHDGTILNATSFPIGKHFVIREVAKALGTSAQEASSILRIFMQGNVSGDQLERINKALFGVQKIWLQNFTDTLAQISRDAPIAKDLYITIDQDYSNWFTTVIASGNYSEYMLSKNPFRIQVIDEKILSDHCTYNKLTAELDIFLAIETIFMHKNLYE